MLLRAMSRYPEAKRRLFDPDARALFVTLTDRFSVRLDYALDSAGDELLGVLPGNDEEWNMLIAYPTACGFVAEDGNSNMLGHYHTAQELCIALSRQLDELCTPITLH